MVVVVETMGFGLNGVCVQSRASRVVGCLGVILSARATITIESGSYLLGLFLDLQGWDGV